MPTKRKLNVVSKPANVTTAKPVLGSAATASANAGRSNVAKPATPPAVATAVSKPAKPASFVGLVRDARGINGETDFSTFTPRDEQYLRFFGIVARANGGRATVTQLYNAGTPRPGKNERLHYIPGTTNSTKATDRDAYDRLAVAGYLTVTGDADNAERRTLTPTAKALASSLYTGK